MYWMKNQSRQENIIYLAAWGVLFLAPLLSYYVRTVNDSRLTFEWMEMMIVWKQFSIYLLLFAIHNFLLAPLLIHQHKRLLYFSIVGAILVGFTLYQCSHRPKHFGERHHLEQFDKRPMEPHDAPPFMDGERPFTDEGHRPPKFNDEHKPDRQMPKPIPPAIIGEHDIIAIILLLLMFGANLGIKGYFKTRDDRKRLLALEKENLEQQLEYLKYQINPHFFMNTLNNIHALVDIDPQKAQETILELSKMMRFVLYEGDKKGVPLTKEFEFIRTYIQLMKLRYTDKVTITVELPQEVPERQIPPLMLITFIENAFKHGISYQHESFIDIKVEISEKLLFTCRNSKAEMPNQEKGGVGLQNVTKRLNLLYGNNYTLNIQDAADVYNVKLEIPLT
jgi:hypothetical protein